MHNDTPADIILGLGKTGLSLLRFLAAERSGLVVCDTRTNPPELAAAQCEFPQVTLRLGALDSQWLCRCSGTIFVSPGISLKEPALLEAARCGVSIAGDIDVFCDFAKAPIVAITGSNGKSTVTTLVGEMAKKAGLNVAVGGNLGTPALELLSDEVQLYVLELSSFQLEACSKLRAEVACCLNLSEDHMDRYANLDEYRAAKLRIFNGANYPIINSAYPDLQSLTARPALSFGEDKNDGDPNHFALLYSRGVYHLSQGSNLLLPVTQLKIRGTHNYQNALAALAIGHALSLPMAAMLDVLRAFKGLPHRCQWLCERSGVSWYNDSKATNVGAACAAIEGLGQDINGKLVLIAGGDGKGADFSPLYQPVARYCRAVILLGRDADKLAASLSGSVPLQRVNSLEQAVNLAAQLAQTGDAVLLSPACASLDMFKHFEQRGEVFAKVVEALL